jgi:hypothetical protein
MRICRPFAWLLALGIALSEGKAQVLISEFVAENNNGLQDEDGGREDWIELFNASTGAVDLAGWRLTDEEDDPGKWTFPPVTLPPQQFLVVFASEKDRTNAAGTLHANFKLRAEGEYLALVQPDGAVAQAFEPAYPPQQGDIAYGLPLDSSTLVLVDAGAPCAALPAGLDVSTGWVARAGVDDSGWLPGVTGVGFDLQPDYLPLIGLNLQAALYPTNAAAIIRVPFAVSNLPPLRSLLFDLQYDDGVVAWLNGRELVRSHVPPGPPWILPRATTNRADNLASVFASFDVSFAIGDLVAETNVLALLGLNSAADDDDFLVAPRLRGIQWSAPDLTPVYFTQPTPGQANTGALAGAVADASFSVDRGFFTNGFPVSVSCATPASTLVYTLDGSAPSLTNGFAVAGGAGDGPVATLSVTGTTVVRARAFRAGWAASAPAARTYLFPAMVPLQPPNPPGYPSQWIQSNGSAYSADYAMDPRIVTSPAYSNKIAAALLSLPTLSIATAIPNLFDRYAGIYANPLSEGPGWERPASVEWMDPATGESWQSEAGLRIQGGFFRQPSATPKHSFRLIFRGQYGATALRQRVFDEPGAATSFDSITLRAQANDGYSFSSWNGANVLYLRDEFGRELMRDMGQAAPHGNYVHLYLNGLYWGLFNPVEHADESFSAAYFGGDKATWDAINSGELVNGTMAAWNALVSQCSVGVSSIESYLRVQGRNPDGTVNPAYPNYIEIDNCIDYILLNLWGGNWDWPFKNYWVGRNRVGTEGFRFYVWDYEDTIGTQRSPLHFRASTSSGVAIPHYYLANNAEYRLRFADHVQKHFFNEPLFAPASLIARFTNMAAHIAGGIVAESARWGDQSGPLYTPAQWESAVANIVVGYLPYRTDIALGQFRSAGLYPALAAPVFSQRGGLVPPGFALAIAATSSVYVTLDGSDPRQFGTGAAVGALYSNAVPLDASCVVRARAQAGGVWSALVEFPFVVDAPSPLRVSEVMYHPRGPTEAEAAAGYREQDFEFVELHNTGATVGWPGYRFAAGLDFDFGTSPRAPLAPGDYALLVRHRAAFAQRYGTAAAARVVGVFSNALANGGETLALERPLTGERLSFAYDAGAGWPAGADGAGHSLVPLTEADPTGHALNHGANWRASAFRDGSPGALDPDPVADLVLNEVAANTTTNLPGRDSNDWIELFNLASDSVCFASWFLSDDADELAKWRLPTNGSLDAGAWIVFDEIAGFCSDTNNGFGLASAGETVLLSHLPGNGRDRVADARKLGGQSDGATLGRYADGQPWWTAMAPTPGASNRLAAPRVAISEIMFHPCDTNSPPQDNVRDEYIELHNAGTEPVELANSNGAWRLSGSVDFTLPAGTTLAPAERLLAVSFPPTNLAELAAFRTAHGSQGALPRAVGPYAGRLPNDGGRVALEYPVAPHVPGDPLVWALVDEAIYFDDEPWTRGADGNGLALHRLEADANGSNPANWRAGLPSLCGGAIEYPELKMDISPCAASGLRIVWPSRAGFLYDLETTPDAASPWSGSQVIRAAGPTSTVGYLDVPPAQLFRSRQRDR